MKCLTFSHVTLPSIKRLIQKVGIACGVLFKKKSVVVQTLTSQLTN